ncbi:MAG: hypothetical protein AAGF23_16980, partial [Acidobacteriota bacterium]
VLLITVFPGAELQRIAFIVMLVFILPSVLAGLADRSYKRRGVEPTPKVRAFLDGILLFYHHTSLGSITKPILYVYTSNLRRQRAYSLLGLAFLVLYLGIFGQMILSASDRSMLHGYRYLPPRDGELSVRDRYYDNMRESGPRHARYPSLSSDIAEGPYLKLFLPYVPREDNQTLEAKCPEVDPWPWSFERPKKNPSREEETTSIACLSHLYSIELDGEPLEPEFQLYRHPQTGIRGLLAYLPMADLSPGRHALRIEEMDIQNDHPVVHDLPFWR